MKTELNKYNVIWFNPPTFIYPIISHPKIPLAILHVDKVVNPFIEELPKIIRHYDVLSNAIYDMDRYIISEIMKNYQEGNWDMKINSIMLNYRKNKKKYFL